MLTEDRPEPQGDRTEGRGVANRRAALIAAAATKIDCGDRGRRPRLPGRSALRRPESRIFACREHSELTGFVPYELTASVAVAGPVGKWSGAYSNSVAALTGPLHGASSRGLFTGMKTEGLVVFFLSISRFGFGAAACTAILIAAGVFAPPAAASGRHWCFCVAASESGYSPGRPRKVYFSDLFRCEGGEPAISRYEKTYYRRLSASVRVEKSACIAFRREERARQEHGELLRDARRRNTVVRVRWRPGER